MGTGRQLEAKLDHMVGPSIEPSPAPAPLASLWTGDLLGKMLNLLWRAYDEVCRTGIPEDRLDDENWLNQTLVDQMQMLASRRDVFVVSNQRMELSSRAGRRSPPPTSDLGFFLKARRECALAAEAKLLHNSSHISKYVGKLRSHFLKGKYSPFCPAGIMLGYLSLRDATWAFREIQKKLATRLELDARFPRRSHRRSRHTRNLSGGRLGGIFDCHHLLFMFGKQGVQGELL